MPSGSHGGSRGSHSSGGSSRGSSSSSSSSRMSSSYSHGRRVSHHSSYYHGHHHHHHHHGGGIVITSKYAVFIFLIILASIFTFVFITSLNHNNQFLKKIETDREYYIGMIERAELNPDQYVKEGKITGLFNNDACNKWYIEYEIPTSTGGRLEGYTFSVYEYEEIKQYHVGQILEFAVDTPVVTSSTDSINMGYKDIPLENDGEYQDAKSTVTLMWVLTIASCTTIFGLFIGMFKKMKREKENEESKTQYSPVSKSESQFDYCPYCQSKMSKYSTSCPNCGASFRK